MHLTLIVFHDGCFHKHLPVLTMSALHYVSLAYLGKPLLECKKSNYLWPDSRAQNGVRKSQVGETCSLLLGPVQLSGDLIL